jgi:hypothetical protein
MSEEVIGRTYLHLTPPLCDVCGISLQYHSEEDLISCGISTEEE